MYLISTLCSCKRARKGPQMMIFSIFSAYIIIAGKHIDIYVKKVSHHIMEIEPSHSSRIVE